MVQLPVDDDTAFYIVSLVYLLTFQANSQKDVLWFSSLCLLCIFAAQIEIVLQGAPAAAQVQHSPQRAGEVIFGPPDGCRQVKSFCQIGKRFLS